MRPAADVTQDGIAQQARRGGAADAGVMIQSQASPDAAREIDARIDDEADRNANEAFDDDGYVLALLKRARAFVLDEGGKRRAPSSRTAKDYARKCRHADTLLAAIPGSNHDALATLLARYAPSKNSFFAMRAALRWRLCNEAAENIKSMQRLYGTASKTVAFKSFASKLETICNQADVLASIKRADLLVAAAIESKPRRSKKLVLKRLDTDWRDQFLAANSSSPTYRHAGVILVTCGLRPDELQKGVLIERVGEHVRFTIHGAKVTQHSGQQVRSMMAPATGLPDWFVEELSDEPRRFSVSAGPLRQHLRRLSESMYPRRNPPIVISAYCFRHALATDLRDDGWEIEEVAAVLGESVAETSLHYGFRLRGLGRGRQKPLIVRGAVETTRPVRPPDHGFVQQKISLRTLGKSPKP